VNFTTRAFQFRFDRQADHVVGMNWFLRTIETGGNKRVVLIQDLAEACSTNQNIDVVLLDNDPPDETGQ
jgi:hypothetical protein